MKRSNCGNGAAVRQACSPRYRFPGIKLRLYLSVSRSIRTDTDKLYIYSYLILFEFNLPSVHSKKIQTSVNIFIYPLNSRSLSKFLSKTHQTLRRRYNSKSKEVKISKESKEANTVVFQLLEKRKETATFYEIIRNFR